MNMLHKNLAEPQIISKSVGENVCKNPKVSIVIPTYNSSDYIIETLDSIFAQTFTDFETIIVNDGSPDTAKFESVIEPYLNKIVYIKQNNLGATFARNAAIENASGEYIGFLDSDDMWFPNFLESQLNFLEQNKVDMVYCDAQLFGEEYFEGTTFMQKAPSKGEVNVISLLKNTCNVITSGTLVKKNVLVAVGMFEKKKVRGHDFILWLKIAHHGYKIKYQKKVLVKHRVRFDGISGDLIERSKRPIEVFSRIKDNISISETEMAVMEERLKDYKLDLELQISKKYFLSKNFDEATLNLKKAYKIKPSFRLKLITLLMPILPQVLLKIYKLNHKEIR